MRGNTLGFLAGQQIERERDDFQCMGSIWSIYRILLTNTLTVEYRVSALGAELFNR